METKTSSVLPAVATTDKKGHCWHPYYNKENGTGSGADQCCWCGKHSFYEFLFAMDSGDFVGHGKYARIIKTSRGVQYYRPEQRDEPCPAR